MSKAVLSSKTNKEQLLGLASGLFREHQSALISKPDFRRAAKVEGMDGIGITGAGMRPTTSLPSLIVSLVLALLGRLPIAKGCGRVQHKGKTPSPCFLCSPRARRTQLKTKPIGLLAISLVTVINKRDLRGGKEAVSDTTQIQEWAERKSTLVQQMLLQ